MYDLKLSLFCHYRKNLIKDRVKVYQTLNDNGIETPRYIVCDRSDLDNMPEFEEFDDYLEINGETFHKVTRVHMIQHVVVIFLALSVAGKETMS